MRKILITVIVALPFYLSAQTLQNFPVLTGEYLGQKTPDTIPEIFAKDIVSDSTWYEHCQLAISPRGDEIYWSAFSKKYPRADEKGNTEQIYYSKIENGKWTKPALAEFITDHLEIANGSPVFSPDGNSIYFNSDRPGGLGRTDVWYVERTNEKWNTPVNVGAQVNNENDNWAPSFSNNETAYRMDDYGNNPDEKPIRFEYSDITFANPSTVKIHPDFYPFYSIYVSPNEDYLIFSGYHYLGAGVLDLYICYKDDQGNWGYPIMLRDQINTETVERFPVVSPDGKFLFFVRQDDTHNFYWVSTRILDKYRSESLEKINNPPFKEIKLKPEELEKFVGVYSKPGVPPRIAISREANELRLETGGKTYHLECYGENKFKYDKRMVKIEFFPNDSLMVGQWGIQKFTIKKEDL